MSNPIPTYFTSAPSAERDLSRRSFLRFLPYSITGSVLAVSASVPGNSAQAAGRFRRRLLREPRRVAFPEHKKVEKGTSFYADILNHSREEFKDYGDRPTTAHETSHGIHSYLRTKYVVELGRRVNAFYVGQDTAYLLDEPGIRKSAVISFIPKSLRGDRFKTYLEEQKEWDDTPLYVFDEWVAYVNGSIVAIEEAAGKKPDGSRNNIAFACLEFFVYAAAVGMAVERYDRRYFTQQEQFRDFLRWHLQRSMEVHDRAAAFEEFTWNPDYLRELRTGRDANDVRSFLRDRLEMNLPDLLG